jgi:hypothetical protein
MSNPTTPFNWQMPTNTDLVTDLPADFEVFGQAVATSMADLLGGTTGQILSKATNADMDFTWIANDQGDITGVTAGTGISGGGTSGTVTVTNSMATAIDAKGDLIGGTGADTFSRLAVGANGTVLTADSAEATGMKWATAGGGGLVLINSTSFTTSSAVNVDSVFTSTYRNYRIVISYNSSANINLQMRLRASGSTITTAKYEIRGWTNNGSALNAETSNTATLWHIGSGGVSGGGGSYDIFAPNVGTFITISGGQAGITTGAYGAGTGVAGYFDQSQTADGFQIFPSSGTLTGTVRTYGYANS